MDTDSHTNLKSYKSAKLVISLFRLFMGLTFLLYMLFDGSVKIRTYAEELCQNNGFTENIFYPTIAYLFIFVTLFKAIEIVPNFYSTYILEQRHVKSDLKLTKWLVSFMVNVIVNVLVVVIFGTFVYMVIYYSGHYFWFPMAVIWLSVSLTIGRDNYRIVKYSKQSQSLSNNNLLDLIKPICNKTGYIIDNFCILVSNHKRQNASILISDNKDNQTTAFFTDTLLENFSDSEVRSLFANKLFHYTKRTEGKVFYYSFAVVMIGFWMFALSFIFSVDKIQNIELIDIAGFPSLLLSIILGGLFLFPLQSEFCRKTVRDADKFTVENIPKHDAFISALAKLSAVNRLAVNESLPLQFFFYQSPSIVQRIKRIDRNA